MRRIRTATAAPGGVMVEIEVENAYTDGSSRFDRVFVASDAIEGRSAQEREAAVLAAIDAERQLDGLVLTDGSPDTKERAERRLMRRRANWWEWETMRAEAVRRALPGPVVNPLTNRADALWAKVEEALAEWRAL